MTIVATRSPRETAVRPRSWVRDAAALAEQRWKRLSRAGSKALRYFRAPRDLRLLREQFAQASRDISIVTDQRYADQRHLCRAEGRVYSQNNEDGIIAAIFARIGDGSRTFVEIGSGDGSQNNTRLLLEIGWRGVWIDCGAANTRAIQDGFSDYLADGRLTYIDAMIDRDNIVPLLRRAGVPHTIDLLSVDVDANTHHIWRALSTYEARVAVIEYNASYPPSVDYEFPYDPAAMWDGSNRYGASLKALERIGGQIGMQLVGCDWHGVNAFFVAKGEVADRFIGPGSAELHYQPPRYSFEQPFGHPAASPRSY